MKLNKKTQMTIDSRYKGMTYTVQRCMIKTYLMLNNIIITDPKSELKIHN